MSKAAELAALIGSQTAQTNRNMMINGAMQVSQRSTSVASITTSGYRTLDRFNLLVESIGTWTMSQDTDVPTGQGFAKSLKIDCTTADGSPAAADRMFLRQNLEGQDLQRMKKGTANAESVTLSFWVKATKTGTHVVNLLDLDNSRMICKTYTISTTNTWEKQEIVYTGDTTGAFDNDNAGSLQLEWWLAAGTNSTSGTLQTTWGSLVAANRAVGQVNTADNTNNNWAITGVQLEIGEQATPFEHRSFADELLRCQRYAYKIGGSRNDTYGPGMGLYQDGNEFNFGPVFPPATFRANPALTVYGTAPAIKINGSATTGCTATISCAANEMQFIRLTKSSHGLSASDVANMNFASTSDYIILDAEL